MLYYFSGTGNSRWVAERLAELLGDRAVDLAHIMRELPHGQSIAVSQEPRLGIIFPVYAWAPPAIVLEFIKKLKIEPNTYTFTICTCGDEAGNAIDILKKHLSLNSGYSIVMPNNFILFGTDSQEVATKKIQEASKRLPVIAAALSKEFPIFEVKKGTASGFKSTVIAGLFNSFGRSPKAFHTNTAACNGCGICEQHCPVGCIQMKDGRPVWGKQAGCTLCFSCINRCPPQAIQYRKLTQNKSRYYFGKD